MLTSSRFEATASAPARSGSASRARWTFALRRAVAFGLALSAQACVVINDSSEFVLEPDPSVVAYVAPTPPPSADDCRYAGVAGRCDDGVPLSCSPNGQWQVAGAACDIACTDGRCAECVPGTGACTGDESGRRTCSELGRWVNAAPCGLDAPICRNGACLACEASQRTCRDGIPQECGQDGRWLARPACATGQSCVPETGECATCSVGERRRCRGALGACAAGEQFCQEDLTWSACSVQPREDTCAPGDDGDCDGRPNSPSSGGCTCDADASCGPDTDVGECARGVSTCTDGAYGECVGAVGRQQRDCTSPLDENCDGQPDDTLDDTCQCLVTGEPEPCADSPYPALGICRPTTRLCRLSAGLTSSYWEECRGGVPPQARDCSSHVDNDCDGTPDDESESCACAPGASEPCGEGSCFGVRTCVLSDARDATFWSECTVTAAWNFGDPQPITGLGVGAPLWGPALFDEGRGFVFGAGDPEDIFVSSRSDATAAFALARPVTGVNTNWSDGTPFVSADGRRLYFDSTRAGMSRDLFRASGEPGAWAAPVRLDDVSGDWNDLNPWLSADERTLIFVSDRPGGAGRQDLWTSAWDGGRFTPPVNLSSLNTSWSDEGASLTRDGLAVFFASDRPGGEGGLDIWTAVRATVTEPFGPPRPLGAVNSESIDLDPALSPDGRELFFSSARAGTQQLYRATRTCD
jgi:hypothetical protein